MKLASPSQLQVEQEVPRQSQTVKAGSLLSEAERQMASSTGVVYAIAYEGQNYMVNTETQVPRQSTVPRTQAGELYGVASVTGG